MWPRPDASLVRVVMAPSVFASNTLLCGAGQSSHTRTAEVLTFSSGTAQDDSKQGASSLFTFHFDATAVGFDGPSGDGQAEADTAGVPRAGVVHAVEALEDPLAMRGGNPRARVPHFDDRILAAGARGDTDLPLVRRVLDRVG